MRFCIAKYHLFISVRVARARGTPEKHLIAAVECGVVLEAAHDVSLCGANAALNEIYMTWRYAPNPATKETAEGLLDKLRPLSDQECMDLIRKVQAEYRLPEKARTIGEMLAEARQRSGAQKLSGHDIMALERFDPATRHMIVFDVLTHDSPVGWKGEKMRLFLTDAGYSKALENQEKGHIKIRNHAKVLSGDLHYDHKDRER